ncbi:hypothetical protein [Achromobacter animicus]|uniref:hypothetical protein n=1 Tax=Achromobacter animicus TaxID=1389935 RepID=UPI0028A6D0E2|nr:hypothetical protein [Achromobacter animicus]
MKKIGPTFHAELMAAGLAGLPFIWREDGTFLFTTEATDISPVAMTPDQIDAVLAVYAAHDPEAPAPPNVPAVVSRFQGREAMHRTPHGDGSLFDATEAVLEHPDTPPMYRRAWDDLQEFHFDSEMLIALATALGLTEQDRKNLFILAGSIRA